MAKLRTVTPKKGAKPKGIDTPESAPRRSARDTTPSAKKVAADALSAVSKVVKSVTPAKSTPAKASTTKAKATTAKACPAKTTRATTKKSPAKADANETPVEESPAKSRGRPRKAAATEPSKAEPSGVAKDTKPMRFRRAGDPLATEDNGGWIPITKKASPAKRGAKAKATGDKSYKNQETVDDDSEDDDGGFMGIVQSIEALSPRTPSRPRKESPSRAVSRSPAPRGRRQSPKKTSAAAPKSPVRATSKSPKPRTVAKARSKSPQKKAQANVLDEDSEFPTKTRSKSPAKPAAKSRSRSPGKRAPVNVHFQDEEECEPEPDFAELPPSRRSKSPSKPKTTASSDDPSVTARKRSESPAKKAGPGRPKKRPTEISTRTRSRSSASRSPSVDAAPENLKIQKTRGLGSPVRIQQPGANASRTFSPHKPASQAGLPQTAMRPRSPSPDKAGKGKSKSSTTNKARSPSRKPDFFTCFNSNSIEGKILQRVEAEAFKFAKAKLAKNEPFREVPDWKAEHYEVIAFKRGLDRARKEFAMRTIAGNEEQHQKNSPKKRSRSKSRSRSPSKSKSKGEGGSEPPSVNGVDPPSESEESELDEDRDFVYDAQTGPAKRVPAKRKAADSLPSPLKKMARTPSRGNSPTKRSPTKSSPPKAKGKRKAATTSEPPPLVREGESSAPNRGPIHSSTNPQFVRGIDNKRNPFFESMPAPEVWHRRMPPYFPFGETPYMEQVMSNQISADLAKGEKPAKEASGLKSLWGWFGSKSNAEAQKVESTAQDGENRVLPGQLPSATDAEIKRFATQLQGQSKGQKRKASDEQVAAPSSKAPKRRRGPGSDE
ncbi:uncharacterized protein LTR77_011033 [Saxophila tyrrhenica]|uniref:Uncharacterized protein n=1 Tax=Saxophila tyrrhenica TaxID=1690608 RepID=A0AAV9NXJ9_9PEZI|nr:hypothetical protein LTR77_011033 [Saxophila tyrrhenica]